MKYRIHFSGFTDVRASNEVDAGNMFEKMDMEDLNQIQIEVIEGLD